MTVPQEVRLCFLSVLDQQRTCQLSFSGVGALVSPSVESGVEHWSKQFEQSTVTSNLEIMRRLWSARTAPDVLRHRPCTDAACVEVADASNGNGDCDVTAATSTATSTALTQAPSSPTSL